VLKNILVSASRKKAVQTSHVRWSDTKVPGFINYGDPFPQVSSVFLSEKNVLYIKLLGVGDLCFHFVILCTCHRAQCNISAQHLTTTCTQLWSLKIYQIRRVSLPKRREQLLCLHVCAFPRLWSPLDSRAAAACRQVPQAPGTSRQPWQAAQPVVAGIFSCSNTVCSAQASPHRAKTSASSSCEAASRLASPAWEMPKTQRKARRSISEALLPSPGELPASRCQPAAQPCAQQRVDGLS